ncbi:MAG: AAA family ATPase [Myxococcales bacterium]|nr:AAA family ATPase [Myxococcales bacterium]
MHPSYDPDHLQTALGRFRAFFKELREVFVERDDVLTQFGLALLCRQHVLMTGPPGTGKSQLAALTLGRIIDETDGAPSLFSRQFTENTVQTDLVGPIDFKTLMESGRTEHFTDEGMLGSVHAFLDEVFDGRDMLLRSTLNILHEREVKQGGVVTKGRIECAFMTSSRYIAEVLESARETLLAFIDRISFISFIPRGFAKPESLATVVRRHGGGFGQHRPTAYLSVQDLDVLQAAADLTYVPEEICEAIAQLITSLDEELSEAQRFDPKFQPTRYLSTRSAVQATKVVRAAVVLDKIFHRPERPLQARHEDLEMLRFYLLLGGVARESIAELAARETDPRERRQLDIMATEAEVFARCFEKLPRVETPLQPRRLELEALEQMAKHARRSADPEALSKAVGALIEATESGATDASKAASLLVDTVGTLSREALRGGLTPELGLDEGLAAVGDHIREIASKLERAPGQGRPLAQWLRGRLLRLVDDGLRLMVVPSATTLEALAAGKEGPLAKQTNALLSRMESLASLRRQLRSDGATTLGPEGRDPAWEGALAKLEDELVLLWDARFRLTAQQLLRQADALPLAKVLRSLSPALEQLAADAERFGALGRRSELVRRVTGPRLEPLVARAFQNIDGRDRAVMIEEVDAVVAELRAAGLGEAVSADRFVAWSLPVLVRDGGTPPEVPPAVTDRPSYDSARAQDPPVSITETLVRIALCALPPESHSADSPEHATRAVWDTLRALPEEDQRRVVSLDLARIGRGVQRLESWWNTLSETAGGKGRSVELLESVVGSGYLRALRGDGEPLRLVAQIEHLAEVFPASTERGARLREQIERLDATVTRVLVDLLENRSERAWSEVLAPEASS